MSSPGTARRLWALGEPFHAVTYFADECRVAGTSAGLKGFWQTYFAFRAAPLGAVGPEVVTATFYNFAPSFVARRVPEVWEVVSPADALAARLSGVDAAVRRALGDDWPGSAGGRRGGAPGPRRGRCRRPARPAARGREHRRSGLRASRTWRSGSR